MHRLNVVFILHLLLLAACSSSSQKSADYHVKFVSPSQGASVSGLVEVKLDLTLPEPASKLEIGVQGEELVSPIPVTTTQQWNTLNVPNGPQTLVVNVTDASGQQWSDKLTLAVKNPDFRLLHYQANATAYAKGDLVKLELKYTAAGLRLAADFGALDDGFRGSDVNVQDLGNGDYELAYRLSASDAVGPGRYPVIITAVNAVEESLSMPIDLRLRSGPRLPISIEHASFIDRDDFPAATSSPSAPVVGQISGATQLVSGAPQTLTVTWSQPAASSADRILIRADGYSGYYVAEIADAASHQAELPVNLQFAQDTPQASPLDLYLAIIDAAGNQSNWLRYPVNTQTLSPFQVGVTLLWGTAADLDLQVTSPNGKTVTYNSRSADGGLLDLDANSMCSKTLVSAERVTWAPGKAIPGQYTVVANLFDACGAAGADFQVVVDFCGKFQTFSGHFDASDARTDRRSQQVATFTVDCTNELHGTVQYSKVLGHVMDYDWRSAYVPVRAVSTSNATRTVLSETTTDETGQYRLYLPSGIAANYKLEVDASFTPPNSIVPFVQVMDQTGSSPYRFQMAGVDTTQTSYTQADLYITEANNAGALNIIDVVRQGYAWVRTHFSLADANKIPPVIVRWARGQDSPATPGSALNQPVRSYYSPSTTTIYIGALDWDINEYDDSVVAHEFNHHVTRSLGVVAPGGYHSANTRSDPSLALNEAVATALGQQALGYSQYADTLRDWTAVIDIETLPASNLSFANTDRGTDNNQQTGKVSENLVAAVLWDLMDPQGGALEPWDQFDSTYSDTLASISGYLPTIASHDRGAPGPDLVDLLDGWRCHRGATAGDDARLKTLLDERNFNYAVSSNFHCP